MIYLVRHGQTDWNAKAKIQGQTDIELNETGMLQAEKVREKIKNIKIDQIISSDLKRARKTAEIINEAFNKKIYYDKRLREMNYGEIEGQVKGEITKEMWDMLNYEPQKINAEDRADVFKRTTELLKEIEKSNENVLLVSHGGVIRVMIYYLEGNEYYDNSKYMETYNMIKINNSDIIGYDDITHKICKL